MGHIWTDVHQVGDALAAFSPGIALEEFSDLEEEHHKDRLRKLRLGPRQETDAERTDGSNRHQEMLVEGITLHDSVPSLMQRLVPC